MARAIAQIDKDIDGVRRQLFARVGKFNRQSAFEWQRAWDAHPELQQRHDALFRERGFAQLERDQREHDRAMGRRKAK